MSRIIEFDFVVAEGISCSFGDALKEISTGCPVLIKEINIGPE